MTTSNADAEFDFLVYGLIGVEYLLEIDAAIAAGAQRRIHREQRCAGGSAALTAAALAHWGARVILMGNPLGDDPNGRLVSRQLAAIPNLKLRTPTLAQFETPYTVTIHAPDDQPAILIRHGDVENYLNTPRNDNSPGWPRARLVFCDSEFGSRAEDLTLWCGKSTTPLILKGLASERPQTTPPSGIMVTLPSGGNWASMERLTLQLARRLSTLVVALERHSFNGVWARPEGRSGRFCLPAAGCNPSGLLGLEEVFHASLAWGRFQDWDWDDSLRYAMAAATLKASSAAGMEGIPERAAIEAVVRGRGKSPAMR